jgi:hypothetical protein
MTDAMALSTVHLSPQHDPSLARRVVTAQGVLVARPITLVVREAGHQTMFNRLKCLSSKPSQRSHPHLLRQHGTVAAIFIIVVIFLPAQICTAIGTPAPVTHLDLMVTIMMVDPVKVVVDSDKE